MKKKDKLFPSNMKPSPSYPPSYPEGDFDYTAYSGPTLDEQWLELKKGGERHYKTGGIEPIDLYRSAGVLKEFSIGCIIKYAFRNSHKPINQTDMDDIIFYAKALKLLGKEGK